MNHEQFFEQDDFISLTARYDERREINEYLRATSRKKMSREEFCAYNERIRVNNLRYILNNLKIPKGFVDSMINIGNVPMVESDLDGIVYSLLTDTTWSEVGPNCQLDARGRTALHLLRDLDVEEPSIWIAVLQSGIDKDQLDNEGRSAMDGASPEFVECVRFYETGVVS